MSLRQDLALGLLRLVSGLMLVQHGVQKHFGWLLPADRPFSGPPDAYSQPWIAGTLEIAGGLLLAAGLFTRPVAFLLSGLMAAAYFIAHASDGFWPILNRGELAALYCFVFLLFTALGGGRFSLDAVIARARPAAHRRHDTAPTPTPYPDERRKERRRKKARVTSR